MMIFFLFMALALHHGSSVPLYKTKGEDTSLCVAERLVSDAACHCFIASHANLIPEEMSGYCHDGFGADLTQLAAFCGPYFDENGSLNVERYTAALKKTHRECYGEEMNGLVRQIFTDDNPYNFDFDDSWNSGIGNDPINVGGIDFAWHPVGSNGNYGVSLSAPGYGSSLTYYSGSNSASGTFPLPGNSGGTFNVGYNPSGQPSYDPRQPANYHFGVSFPF